MKKILFFLSLIFLGVSCTESSKDKATEIIDQIRSFFAPDKRTAIFQVEATDNNPVRLVGETNLKVAKDSLLNLLRYLQISFIDSVIVLPDDNVEKLFALINVSVANLRSTPQHSAELTTQALLGTPLLILKKQHGWCLVQTPDKYIAWTNDESLKSCSQQELEDWKNRKKVIFLQNTGFSMDTLKQHRLTDLVAGNILAIVNESEDYWCIQYPDGRKGFIQKNEAEEWQSWLGHANADESTITQSAYQFLGIPYLWGGTSAKGMDCSGFTKTVFMLQGVILPRDASQQVQIGEDIDSIGDFGKLQTGDLLFFGAKKEDGTERVVHVGLWLENMQYIHASGDVHISSMDSTSSLYDEFNRGRYLRAKRIFMMEHSMSRLFDRP